MERFSRSHHFSSFLPVIFHTVPNCAQRRPRPLSTTVSIPHFNLDSSGFKYYLSESYQGEGTSYCAGDFQYSYRRCVERDEGTCVRHITIKVYDQVVKNPEYDPYALDVTIEGKFWHRVHEY